MNQQIVIFSDGAKQGTTAYYGCLVLRVFHYKHEKRPTGTAVRAISCLGRQDEATSQVGEIMGAMRGFEIAREMAMNTGANFRVTLYSDSMYVVNLLEWARKWSRANWQTNDGNTPANLALVQQLYEVASSIDATAEHIKGHDGWLLNEYADQLCQTGKVILPVAGEVLMYPDVSYGAPLETLPALNGLSGNAKVPK